MAVEISATSSFVYTIVSIIHVYDSMFTYFDTKSITFETKAKVTTNIRCVNDVGVPNLTSKKKLRQYFHFHDNRGGTFNSRERDECNEIKDSVDKELMLVIERTM